MRSGVSEKLAPLSPLGKWQTPEAIADMILFCPPTARRM